MLYKNPPLYYVNILTLETTFTFAWVLAQDEFVDVFDILIHIITRLIETVLLVYTGWGGKQLHNKTLWNLKKKLKSMITGTTILTLDVIESSHPMLHDYHCPFPVQKSETQQLPDQLHQLES